MFFVKDYCSVRAGRGIFHDTKNLIWMQFSLPTRDMPHCIKRKRDFMWCAAAFQNQCYVGHPDSPICSAFQQLPLSLRIWVTVNEHHSFFSLLQLFWVFGSIKIPEKQPFIYDSAHINTNSLICIDVWSGCIFHFTQPAFQFLPDRGSRRIFS